MSSRDPFDPLEGDVGATLDLHRLTAPEARVAVEGLIRRARAGELLHVITGKGRNSAAGPVLRNTIRPMLKSGALARVASWGSDDHDGGFLIRIRR